MGKIVLEHFPEYLSLTADIGAEVFNIPKDTWDRLDGAARWTANQKFIDDTIARDDEIVLSTTDVRRGTWFERELRYLASKGYTPSRRGGRTVLTKT